MKKKTIATILTICMVAALLTACGGGEYKDEAAPNESEITVPNEADTAPPVEAVESGTPAAARRYSNMIWTGDEGYVIRLNENGNVNITSPYGDENTEDAFHSAYFAGIAKFTGIAQFCFLDDEYFIGLKLDGTVFSYAGDDDDSRKSVKLKEELATWKDIIDICIVEDYFCVAGLTKDGEIGLCCLKQDGTMFFPKEIQLYFEENYPEAQTFNEMNVVGIYGNDYGFIFLRADGTVGGFNEDLPDFVF